MAITFNTKHIGEFREVDAGNYFTYKMAEGPAFGEYIHEVDVLDGYRYAKVLKTVAYIVVDEDEYGQPVVEKWSIEDHFTYTKE